MAKIMSASFVLVLVVVTLVMMNIYGVVEGKVGRGNNLNQLEKDEYDCRLLQELCFYVDPPKYCPRYRKFCTSPQILP